MNGFMASIFSTTNITDILIFLYVIEQSIDFKKEVERPLIVLLVYA